MRTPRVALCLCLVLLPPAVAAAQPIDRPAVRLIATGGTIASHPTGRLTADDLAALVPGLDRYVRAETEQFSNIPSSELTVTAWLALARRVNRLFDARPALAGIVVASGTDTLEEVAYFLHLTVRHTRPVVVVGAMRPPGALGYDGAANLLQAFRVAAAPASLGRGVLVVLNAEVHSAREVTKADAQGLDAFGSREYGRLGVVGHDRVVYYGRSDRRHTWRSEFDVAAIDSLPRVDVLLAYQGAPGDLIVAAATRGAAGVVVAASGAGSMSPSQLEATRLVLRRGVTVVVASRTGGGRIVPQPTGRTRKRHLTVPPQRVMGEDLSPVKARILLMLALAHTRDQAEIQRMFQEY